MIQTKLLRGLCQMSRTKWDTLSTEIGSKEISSIIKQNKNEIGKTMSEITSQMTKPSLLFSVNKSEKKVANLIVKDGKEILSQTSFRLIKGEDIIRMLPQGQKGSIIKSFINTNKAKRLITEKMNLQELLKQFGLDIRRIKKPTIEMATKSNERFEIVHLTLKDGDNILLKGAYSKSFGIDDRIKSIEKYHFTGVKNRETGYSVNKTVGYSDTDGRNINFELQGFFNRS